MLFRSMTISSEQHRITAATVTMDRKILLVMVSLQAVTHTPDGFDIPPIVAQLLAQGADMHIHRAGLYRVIRIPDGLQQLLPAEGHAGVTEEQPQKLVFLVGKHNPLTVDGQLSRPKLTPFSPTAHQ